MDCSGSAGILHLYEPAEWQPLIPGARSSFAAPAPTTSRASTSRCRPRSLIVFTGVSGSGKSSLAFDTIYAEGQRRYVESLSAYARQFLERMEKPDVDSIDGIAPAIAIRQKNSIRNPRSTVGTTTEIHDYLRLLWARVGRTICRQCGREVDRESPEVVADASERAAGGHPPARRLRHAGRRVRAAGRRPETEPEDEERRPATTADGGVAHAPQPVLPDLVDSVAETLAALRRKGFGRLLVDGRTVLARRRGSRRALRDRAGAAVIVDRVKRGRRRAGRA